MPLFGSSGPPDIGKLIVERNLAGVLKALHYRNDATVRKAAAKALEKWNDLYLDKRGGKRAAEELVACLSDPDAGVRRSVVEALIHNVLTGLDPADSKRLIEPLFRLLTESDPKIRHMALLGLMLFRQEHEERIVGSLIQLLSDPDREIRKSVIASLETFRANSRAIEALLRPLEDSDADVRKEAVKALRLQKTPNILKSLLPLLTDSDPGVRKEAAKSLEAYGSSMLGDKELFGIAWLINTQALETLIALLTDRDPWVRAAASKAVGSCGKYAKIEGSRETRIIEPLEALLSDSYAEVRIGVVQGLAEMGRIWAASSIAPLLTDGDQGVREAVAAALEDLANNILGNPEELKSLIATFADQDRPEMERAVETWESFHKKVDWWRSPSALVGILTMSDSDILRATKKILRWLVGSEAVEPLIELLAPRSSSLFAPASGGATEYSSTRQQVSYSTKRAQVAAARLLGALGESRAVEPLIAFFSRADGIEQMLAVIQSLGALRDRRAVGLLTTLQGHILADVRGASQQSLELIRSR